MSYSEARIQALENELFNLRQENQKLRVKLDMVEKENQEPYCDDWMWK